MFFCLRKCIFNWRPILCWRLWRRPHKKCSKNYTKLGFQKTPLSRSNPFFFSFKCSTHFFSLFEAQLSPYDIVPMNSCKLGDLPIRLGAHYLYLHQGNCFHSIIFSDMRTLHNGGKTFFFQALLDYYHFFFLLVMFCAFNNSFFALKRSLSLSKIHLSMW